MASTVLELRCDKCHRTTQIMRDDAHVASIKCNITNQCDGNLVLQARRATLSIVTPTKNADVEDFIQRGIQYRPYIPTRLIDTLIPVMAGSRRLVLAVPTNMIKSSLPASAQPNDVYFNDGTVSFIDLLLIAKTSVYTPIAQYEFVIPVGTTKISGGDLTGKSLTIDPKLHKVSVTINNNPIPDKFFSVSTNQVILVDPVMGVSNQVSIVVSAYKLIDQRKLRFRQVRNIVNPPATPLEHPEGAFVDSVWSDINAVLINGVHHTLYISDAMTSFKSANYYIDSIEGVTVFERDRLVDGVYYRGITEFLQKVEWKTSKFGKMCLLVGADPYRYVDKTYDVVFPLTGFLKEHALAGETTAIGSIFLVDPSAAVKVDRIEVVDSMPTYTKTNGVTTATINVNDEHVLGVV